MICPNCKYEGMMDDIDGCIIKCPKCNTVFNEDE